VFVLDQHTELDFNSDSSNKLLSTDKTCRTIGIDNITFSQPELAYINDVCA
jgi:hypothetical protein